MKEYTKKWNKEDMIAGRRGTSRAFSKSGWKSFFSRYALEVNKPLRAPRMVTSRKSNALDNLKISRQGIGINLKESNSLNSFTAVSWWCLEYLYISFWTANMYLNLFKVAVQGIIDKTKVKVVSGNTKLESLPAKTNTNPSAKTNINRVIPMLCSAL